MQKSDWTVPDTMLDASANSKLPETTLHDSHKCWVIATKSLANVFSYVAALITRGVLESAVKPVTDQVADIFQLRTNYLKGDTDAITRLGIAPAFSGCGARIEEAGLQADATYSST